MLSQLCSTFQSPALRQITLDVARVGGVNLGQGVCQLPAPAFLVEAAGSAARDGVNRYTHPRGLPSLRLALANKLEQFNKISNLDPETEILVTCGVTAAFEAVCAVLLDPGDEVVVFEPSYPYHVQALRRYGAKIRAIRLQPPDWRLDEESIGRVCGPRTKFVLLNTPNNPTGRVLDLGELQVVARAIEGTDALLVTDEIYEHMAFDGKAHVSPASLPELRNRTVTMGGYSKTFSITGWRIGYLAAPEWLAEPLATYLDAAYVCAPAPLQEAVAQAVRHFVSEFYVDLGVKYQAKRDRFVAGLREIGLDPMVPEGAYYLLCGYEGVAPGVSSDEFVRRMIENCGVGAVPSSDFVADAGDAPWVRFCLAVEDNVLDDALGRLRRL